jgi:hypothetical protein
MKLDPPQRATRHPTAEPWGGPDLVAERLPGRWSLERVVEGKHSQQGSMQGVATFRPLGNGAIAYREEGRLRLPDGETFDAFRDYLYGRAPDGFAVFFAETPPRLFHDIRLHHGEAGALAGEAEHLCGQDHYSTQYAFHADGRFVIRHDVRGPRKAYRMTTWYERMELR